MTSDMSYEACAHDALQATRGLASLPSDADVAGVLADGLAGVIYATLAVAAAIRETSGSADV